MKSVVETANTLNLAVAEDDIPALLEVLPEELTNELLELEQERVAEQEARGKDTTGEENQEPLRKFLVRGLAEALQTSASSLKGLKMWTPTAEGFHE